MLPAQRPAEDDAPVRWYDHWAVKVLVWSVPVVFSTGIAYASLGVLADDVDRLKEADADKRITVIEERVKHLEELQKIVSTTNENVIRLCQAQGVACK